jgi:hypothetical protein
MIVPVRRSRTPRVRIGRRLGARFVVALGAAALVMSGGALTSQAVASSCQATGHVLLQRDGVVVWTAHGPRGRFGDEGSVFMCASPSGRTVLLQRSNAPYALSEVTNASVTQPRFAGHFVGFFLRTNVEVYSKFLVVFDRIHGRLELKDLAECDGNDECTGPDMTGYRLAPNGWVAEVWPRLVANAAGLLVTNGSGHYQLDVAQISQLKMSDGTLSWTSNPFGGASVPLGPRVITPRAPRKLSACQLLTPGELAPVLGPKPTSGSSRANCTYTSTQYPGRTLTLTLTMGLRRAQMQARERALPPSYCALGQWWPTDDDFYDLVVARSDQCGNPGTDVRFVIFANGAEVSLRLVAPPLGGGALLAHLANAAVDRLFGVPITRAG